MSSSDKLKIPLQEISSATNGFAESSIIGKGGYGLVYRGKSEQHGMLAIKRLNRVHGQGDHEYGMEVTLLSKYRHENLVSLIGFCGEDGEKILVYKYEPNQSLDKFLHRKDLSWMRRLQICVGAARGLRYLHNETGSGHGVIHRDIKSSNILLDENWNAKISDFGLSKLALTNSADSVVFTAACGTMGYVDPQVLYGCGITQKSDVYSFGVVLYEVLFGKLVAIPGDLVDGRFTVKMAKKHCKEQTLDMMIDPDLRNEMNSDSLSTFSSIAYQCLKKRTEDRPTMSSAVKALEKALRYQQKTNSLQTSTSARPLLGADIRGGEDLFSKNKHTLSQLGRELSIKCLLHSSRSDYASIASLNRGFRTLVRVGELYKLRRSMGIVEHWVYISRGSFKWEAFDPIRCRWMRLPTMDCDESFRFSYKESLAVGTELLVFGKEIDTHEVYKYSILTNSWSRGSKTNTPRSCLFGCASLGDIAIVAGGCGPSGDVLSSAELYNSETGTWVTLPNMNKPRKKCSGVFMESKFFVIGGIGEENRELARGEVYDLETCTWTEILNMVPWLTGGVQLPLAVVKNELYAACYEEQELRKYDKARNLWETVGRLPEKAGTMNKRGVGFQACGDQLIVSRSSPFIELNSWVPDENPPQWSLLATTSLGGSLHNFSVMGC